MPDKAKGIIEQRFKINKPKPEIETKNPEIKKVQKRNDSKNFEKKNSLDLQKNFEKKFEKKVEKKIEKKIEKNDEKNKIERIKKNKEKSSDMNKISEKLIGLEKDIEKFNEYDHVEQKKIESLPNRLSPRIGSSQFFVEKIDNIPRSAHSGISQNQLFPETFEKYREIHSSDSQNPSKPSDFQVFDSIDLQSSVTDSFAIEKFSKKQKKNEIKRILCQLNSLDTSQQSEAFELINNTIFSNIISYKSELKQNSSLLCHAIIIITPTIVTLKHISYEFVSLFTQTVQKICSTKFIISHLSELELYHLCEEFIKILVNENLAYKDSEIEEILKNFTFSLSKILELASSNCIFIVLLRLLINYKTGTHKTIGILIKCLLKLTKSLNKIVFDLNLERILALIHEYLIANNSETDEIGTKAMKTIINELVKIIGENI